MGVACYQLTNEYQVVTSHGVAFLEGPVSREYLEGLDFDQGLHNFRTPQKQKAALMEIAALPQGMVYIVRTDNRVIGYVSFLPPDPYSRWSKHPRVLELGAIEISPDWREYKLGRKLLQLAFTNPVMENYIVITIEFCWHWDLRNTGLDIWQYQKMLTKLFGSVGLEKVMTDDPDILEHMANVLMVRYGKRVPQEDIELFQKMLFMGKGVLYPR
ncbi:GNAT family N-acetyltransferase [Desulfofundulus thermobenzoicus]|uniref:GNAT family N-acetyltransferase n=1 Tax=Desulfofundulus thermobenzoicus TaxID=29376 RepID=A0A6N7IMJ9_9FIRM|nr:GNAT family N-acetyltransferase [Desulfofundulus thermobenzoicus]MQL51205.1 GNAT family N-acetyltransferase [Desulfofundulus thermobenzoicus]HHW43654.1 GNAT family N-acetyltransferase [Desulfotomaculum sp.]